MHLPSDCDHVGLKCWHAFSAFTAPMSVPGGVCWHAPLQGASQHDLCSNDANLVNKLCLRCCNVQSSSKAVYVFAQDVQSSNTGLRAAQQLQQAQ